MVMYSQCLLHLFLSWSDPLLLHNDARPIKQFTEMAQSVQKLHSVRSIREVADHLPLNTHTLTNDIVTARQGTDHSVCPVLEAQSREDVLCPTDLTAVNQDCRTLVCFLGVIREEKFPCYHLVGESLDLLGVKYRLVLSPYCLCEKESV